VNGPSVTCSPSAARAHRLRLRRWGQRFGDDEVAGRAKTVVEIEMSRVQIARLARRNRGELAFIEMNQREVSHH
jgi:hypothetical protein